MSQCLYCESRNSNTGGEQNTEIQFSVIQKNKLQEYRNTEIQVSNIPKYKLQKYRNIKIQITEIQKFKNQP